MQKEKIKIPSWAKYNKELNMYDVDPDVVYPMYLEKLGITEITQNALELARKCFTRDLHKCVNGILGIHILKRPKWALINYKEGVPYNIDEMYAKIK